jgi:glutamine amidotransferase
MREKNTVLIIDYGSGNLRSAAKAFEYIIQNHNLDFDVIISSNPQDIKTASHIVLPGQGAFGDCANALKNIEGMIEILEKAVLTHNKPFLGICVGMQLLATKGLEYGTHEGLNWIEGEIVEINPKNKDLKIPHMGWNVLKLKDNEEHPVLKNLPQNEAHFYFVHSYMFKAKEKQNILGATEYGDDVTAIVGRDNIVGVQFHPEKSQEYGLQILHNFLLWDGVLQD